MAKTVRFDVARCATQIEGKYGLLVTYEHSERVPYGRSDAPTNPCVLSAELVWCESNGELGAMKDLYGVNFLNLLLPGEWAELQRLIREFEFGQNRSA